VKSHKGFTLIELILVMALVGILSVVGIASYTQATIKSRDTKRKNDLNQIAKALELFNNDVGRYPKSDTEGNMLCPTIDGSEDTCIGSIYSFSNSVRSTYMSNLPKDPSVGQSYKYFPSANFDSYSLYAALENEEDKDHVVDSDGRPTTWDISCGTFDCSYKLSEIGLIRVK
jgi:type II secretion system protein G